MSLSSRFTPELTVTAADETITEVSEEKKLIFKFINFVYL